MQITSREAEPGTVERSAAGQGAPQSPPAVRLRRPGWRDPRLLLGLVLVALSVALGSWLVSDAARTSGVYVARDALVPGDMLAQDQLDVREVRVPEGVAGYLAAGSDLEGLVVTRTVGSGELVPQSALVEQADLAIRPVAVPLDGPAPAGITAGATVDLWYVPDEDGAVGDPGGSETAEGPGPHELAAALTVGEVNEADGAFAVGSGTTVHVLVPVEDLSTVLGALAAEGSVEVVHVPGGPPP